MGWGESGWEIAGRGTLRRGAGCPRKRTIDVHRLYKKPSRGNTDGCLKHHILWWSSDHWSLNDIHGVVASFDWLFIFLVLITRMRRTVVI